MGLFDKMKNVANNAKQALEASGLKESATSFIDNIKSNNSSNEPKENVASSSTGFKKAEFEFCDPNTLTYTVSRDFEFRYLDEAPNGQKFYAITKYIGFGEENLEIPSIIDDKYIFEIDDMAFKSVSGIKHIKLPESLSIIGHTAFFECEDLETVILPEKLSSIGIGAFAKTKLEKIEIPDSVDTMFESCFMGCGNLRYVKLPAGLSEIPEKAFSKCSHINTVVFPKDDFKVGNNAFDYASIKLDEFPSNCTFIGNNAFCFSSSSFKDGLKLPKGLTHIGKRGLSYIGCKQIFIPASVKEIGREAFYYSDDVEEIYIEKGCEAELPFGLFNNCKNLIKLSIPSTVSKIDECVFACLENATILGIHGEEGVPEEEFADPDIEPMSDGALQYQWIERIPKGLTIYCEAGSVAMDFARENKINFAKGEF